MDTNQNQQLSTPLIISSSLSQQHRRLSGSLHGLLLLVLVALLSLWAANESSKGFALTVLKASEIHNSLAAQRFNLMYVANGKAARILISASRFVEDHLKSNAKPNVRGVTLQLSSQSMPMAVKVAESRRNENEFVLILNPDLLLPKGNVDADVAAALLRGMTRVRLWNLHGQSGDGASAAVAKEIEESVVIKATKLHLTEFHGLIGSYIA